MIATQEFIPDKDCKHSIRFAPNSNTIVNERETTEDDITSGIYIGRAMLARLGDPKEIIVSIEAK